jgi:anti-sigma regulatory factor (Ser/Thr protein kinase)
VLHQSVERLREVARRGPNDRLVSDFETAIVEIGANVLTHGSPRESRRPVEYSLRWDGQLAVASFADAGPPVHNQIGRAMPALTSEGGRGLALARLLLDELGYKREGNVNIWRLVKRL